MSTAATLDQALDDLAAGRAPEQEAGRRVARLARAMAQTDAGAALLRRHAVQERDHHLIDLARQHCGDLQDVRPKVRRILQWARRYQATGWPRDQHAMTCPPHRLGKPEGLIWAALKCWPDMPGERLLHEILSVSGP